MQDDKAVAGEMEVSFDIEGILEESGVMLKSRMANLVLERVVELSKGISLKVRLHKGSDGKLSPAGIISMKDALPEGDVILDVSGKDKPYV